MKYYYMKKGAAKWLECSKKEWEAYQDAQVSHLYRVKNEAETEAKTKKGKPSPLTEEKKA